MLRDEIPGLKILFPCPAACPASQALGQEQELCGGLEHGLQGMDEVQTARVQAIAKEAQPLPKKDKVAG